MTRRPCPHCGARVRAVYEGAAIDAVPKLVALYGEHDPCPGSYAPVTPTRAPPPRVPASPAPAPRAAPVVVDGACPLGGEVTGQAWAALTGERQPVLEA